jgi:hypothetical protein
MTSNHKYYSMIVVLVALTVIGAGSLPAVAQSTQPGWADDLYQRTQGMVSTYNEQVTEDDLGFAAGQLTGERINLLITDETSGETATFSFRMDDQLRITQLAQGPREDATLRMTTTRATVDQIINAEQPAQVFRSAVRRGDITIRGVTVVNQIKWTAINTVGDALGLFG